MAGTPVEVRVTGMPGSDVKQLTISLNALLSDVENLRSGVAEFIGSATYDPPSLADGAGATTTITVTGAVLGDFVMGASFDKDLQGILLTAWVSAADTVSIRFQNESGGTLDLASGTLRVRTSSPTFTGSAADITAAKLNFGGAAITA